MMAKMFYTMEEAKVALSKSEEDIKQLSREGRLREFRDGPRLMFKADQVEQLKADMAGGGGGDVMSLGPSDTGAAFSLVDSRSSTGSSISLVEPPPAGGEKHDSALVDIGLSGSLGGVPSPGRVAPSESRSGTRAPASVFDVDDGQKVDASAQTTIGAGIQDQINLEGVGSGSGLLDLTRERDDTSLGAVFDELGSAGIPSGAVPSAPPSVGHVGGGGGFADIQESSAVGVMASQPVYVEVPDASASAFGAMALAAAGVVGFGAFLLSAALFNIKPEIIDTIMKGGATYLLLGAAAVGVFAIVGFLLGKVGGK